MTTLSFACSLPGTGIRAIIPATAVFDAYAWPAGLSDEEILERLLALNLALYLAEIGLDTGRIGLLFTLVLVGDTAVTLAITTSDENEEVSQ